MEKQYLNEYITNSSHIASKEYFYDITGFYEYLQIRYPDNDPEESIVQCTGSDAIAFINDQFNNNLSNNTINRKLSSLKSFYNYLNYTYNIGNPFLNIKSLHSHKTVCSLTLDDCSNLLKTINGINKYRDLSIMYLFLTCGLTVSEVINLKLDDLKDGSLYIYNKNGYLKLTDFGFAKQLENEKTYTLCGTPEYLAPEIILNKGHGKAVDWWTLGILLYEMLVGIDPFSDDDPMKTYQKILKGKINFPKTINKDAKSLIKHLLTQDTSKRFGCLKNGVKDILNHRLFEGFDWKNFVYLTMPAPYIPDIKSEDDTSNFEKYPESDTESPSVDKKNDPFLKW